MSGQGTIEDRKPTIEDVVGSLTGFDEIAIQEKFRADLSSLNPTMTMRAVAFILVRRDGKDDKAAYGEVMRMSLLGVKGMFGGDEDGDDEGND